MDIREYWDMYEARVGRKSMMLAKCYCETMLSKNIKFVYFPDLAEKNSAVDLYKEIRKRDGIFQPVTFFGIVLYCEEELTEEYKVMLRLTCGTRINDSYTLGLN